MAEPVQIGEATIPKSCQTWNQHLEASKTDEAEAARLFDLHHQQQRAETEAARAQLGPCPLPPADPAREALKERSWAQDHPFQEQKP